MIASIDCFINAHPFQAAWNSCTRKFSPDYHVYIRELFKEYSWHLSKDWSDVVMHWLQQNTDQDDFHGVCYRTTRLCPAIEKENAPKYIINFALPTRSMKDEGYCDELLDFFSKRETPKPIYSLSGNISLQELFETLLTYSS